MSETISKIIFWKRIAQISAIFAFVVSMLLIVNYAQYKRMDPVKTELINNLVNRLNDNPEDNQLREEIRTLDLLARKAYFTNQWQLRTGGYLLLLSAAILIIAMQIINSNKPKEISFEGEVESFQRQKLARRWIGIGGAVIVLMALVFAWLTHNELANKFSGELSINENEQIQDNEIEIIDEEPIIMGQENSPIIENIVDEEEVKQELKITEEENLISNKEQAIEKPNQEKKPAETANPKEVVPEETNNQSAPATIKSEFISEDEIKANHNAFRGPGSNGISFHKNIPIKWDAATSENIIWRIDVPLHGYNSPIIWDDRLFISGANSAKREVYCIDRNSGAILWTADVSGIEGSPATSPEVTEDTGQAAPGLTTDGKRVYAIFANGDIIAFDMEGNRLWARNLGSADNHYGHSSSLVLYQNILLVQYDIKSSPRVMGLSVKTGETIWETPRKVKVSWASPILVNTGSRTELMLVSEPNVSSYNPLTGEEYWSVKCIFGEVGPSLAYADGIVYAVNEYATLAAVKLGAEPEILWENDEYMSDVPSPIAKDGLLFMATSYGVMLCYDALSGEILWEHEFDNGFYSSPMLVEDKIYLVDMKGVMHIFKAANEYISVGEASLDDDCMTTPAFMDGRIYLRTNKHLFCIGE